MSAKISSLNFNERGRIYIKERKSQDIDSFPAILTPIVQMSFEIKDYNYRSRYSLYVL